MGKEEEKKEHGTIVEPPTRKRGAPYARSRALQVGEVGGWTLFLQLISSRAGLPPARASSSMESCFFGAVDTLAHGSQ